jgi:adenylate cyclase
MKKTLFMIAAASSLLSGALYLSGAGANLEHHTVDMRFRMFPDTESAWDSVLIVAVDGASLESMNWLGWPWPRQIWADITDYLFLNGASAVFFDITFATSSTFSASEDSILGAAASRGNTVFITALGRNQGDSIPAWAILDISLHDEEPYRFAQPPVGPIAEGAAALAAPYAFPDPDGIFRRYPLFFPVTGGAMPSPALALAMLHTGQGEAVYSHGVLHFRGHRIPLSGSHEVQLRYRGPAGTYETIPVGTLLNAMLGDPSADWSPSGLEGKIVLIGYTAADLMDLKPTPYSARTPGVEVIATALDNILTGSFLTGHGPATTLLLSLLLSLLAATALAFVPRVIPAALLALLANAAYAAAALLAFRNGNFLLEMVPPLASGLLTLLAGSVVAYLYATRDSRFLKAAFSQYLSPEVVSQVAANPEMLRLGGEKRFMTAFFSDVGGFTTISEKLDPKDLVALLNIYLTKMTDIILESGGTVDKFEGDAIIAFWGAPLDIPDHAPRAVSAALECTGMHREMNEFLEAAGYPALCTRIGLASGQMVVGNMGSDKRFDYTIMGSDVNLASRLEGVNKVYGTGILISGTTRELLPESFPCREIDTVMVVGQKTPVTIWEPLTETTPATEAYARGLALYRQRRWKEAEKAFESAGDDPPSCFMAAECRQYACEPPPGNWNGIRILTSK